MANPITTSAPRLRIFLSVSLVLLIIIGGAVTTIGIGYLRSISLDVNEVVTRANNSSDQINETKRQIAEYEKNIDAVKLAEQVVAKRASYQYQNDAYSDLLVMASRAGVTIDQYSFESGVDPIGTEVATDAAPSEAAQGDLAASPAVDATGSVSTLKPISITITLTNPVNYKNFLNFLHYIEQNLTKMQIKSISLSSSGDADSKDTINTDSITVEVYTQ